MITKLGIASKVQGDTLTKLWPWKGKMPNDWDSVAGWYWSDVFQRPFQSKESYWMHRGKLHQALDQCKVRGLPANDLLECYARVHHINDILLIVTASDILSHIDSTALKHMPKERLETMTDNEFVIFKLPSCDMAISIMNQLEMNSPEDSDLFAAFIDKGRLIRTSNYGSLPKSE